MTDEEELKRIEDEGCGCAMASGYGCAAETLVAEVRRLRGVIALAETQGSAEYGDWSCPWCGGHDKDKPEYSRIRVTHGTKLTHEPDCPAFTEGGEVR